MSRALEEAEANQHLGSIFWAVVASHADEGETSTTSGASAWTTPDRGRREAGDQARARSGGGCSGV
jgi:hypothetical protein